jgi:hypothetical protein
MVNAVLVAKIVKMLPRLFAHHVQFFKPAENKPSHWQNLMEFGAA